MAPPARDRFLFSSSSSFFAELISCCLIVAFLCPSGCDGQETFDFDIHHRSSDRVKAMLAVAGQDELPERGSPEYYAAMAHRDRLVHGRLLAVADDGAPITFDGGNVTYRFKAFG